MVEVGLSAGDGEEEGVEMKVMGEEGEGLLGGDETPQFVEKGEGGFGDVVVGDSPLGEEDDQLLLDGKGGVGMDLEKDGEGQIQGEGDEVEMGKIDFGIELPEIEDSSSLSAPFHSPTSLSFGFVNNKFIFVLIISGFITMGSLLGLERSIIPILAKETYNQGDFGLLLFVALFGLAKAISNFVVGVMADRFNRKWPGFLGCSIGAMVAALFLVVNQWWEVVLVNIPFGASQGMMGTSLMFMIIDLNPSKRGLAVGIGECTIYGSTAVATFLYPEIAHLANSYTITFFVCLVTQLVGVTLFFFLPDTTPFVLLEKERLEREQEDQIEENLVDEEGGGDMKEKEEEEEEVDEGLKGVLNNFFGNINIVCATQAGFLNNAKDGIAWGLLPIFFKELHKVSLSSYGILLASYPLSWGVCQLGTGYLSDILGRKRLITGGLFVQAFFFILQVFIPIWVEDEGARVALWIVAGIGLGCGTALIYPVLQACVADEADGEWRGMALGLYRFIRDFGYVVGAISAGVAGLFFGVEVMLVAVGVALFLSGLVCLVGMVERDRR